MVNYFERIAAEGAKNKLLVDFHGAFKPSGLRRAYPNLISYEGVKGNENNKWSRDISPEHNVTLPFTRMVAGPMDFTPGALVNAQQANYQIDFFRPMALGTRSHQLAMYVVFESPLQMLCELPTLYYQEPEITQFIAQMPTTWDETRALDCKVGDYVSVARRKGDKWYVGAMTDWTARTLTLDFSFLSDGKWELTFVADGANAAKQAQDYKMAKQTVDAQTKLTVKLAPGGGWTGVLRRSE
ncbi:MAG: glycoside hydrolase family 97 catalytic domain-containing protein, partial [Cyclobacteriaceae bacterium]|nr:glycoside hydrolase family 97 catalytic domain-containing protein [Cyclobacteriaceae bacterium]